MSNYTTELRFVCGHFAGYDHDPEYQEIDDTIDKAIPYVFANYPIFDEDYRNALNTKILRHYYMDCIGQETINLFLFYLNNKMNEIMPLYNQMYLSELLKFNPLYDMDVTTVNDKTAIGDKENKSKRTEDYKYGSLTGTKATGSMVTDEKVDTTNVNKVTDKGSNIGSVAETKIDSLALQNTPQSDLDGVKDLKYLTQYNSSESTTDGSNDVHTENVSDINGTVGVVGKNTNNVTNESSVDVKDTSNRVGDDVLNETFKNTEEYTLHVLGKSGGKSYGQMINEFRSSFLNIDMLVIGELERLFYGLWE